ncbi:unnamed protein product [Xylocopa violacea]|uniref:Uncharacterized protein n=1 Tax=Xylocopa violacea TaxID=135666 RepID=A0ABP1PB56_XYLVO
MLQHPSVELNVTIVRNPSMTVQRTTITLKNEHFPDISDLFVDVGTICDEQQFRIYCRIAEQHYVPVFNFISFKGGLEMICSPEIYVVVDEPILDLLFNSSSMISTLDGSISTEICSKDSNEFKFESDFEDRAAPSVYMLSDIKILQCALTILKDCDTGPGAPFRYLFAKTPPIYRRELKDTDRKMKILLKGFPQPKLKPPCEPFPETKDTRSQVASKSSKKRRN